MKLLSNFNADDMADKLEALMIRHASRGKSGPILIQPTTIVDELYYEDQVEFIKWNWNHRHKQQALLKSLKLLEKLGVIEVVSLTKTKLTLGFIHHKSGQPFKLSFSDKFQKDFGHLLVPRRYIKYGEWQ